MCPCKKEKSGHRDTRGWGGTEERPWEGSEVTTCKPRGAREESEPADTLLLVPAPRTAGRAAAAAEASPGQPELANGGQGRTLRGAAPALPPRGEVSGTASGTRKGLVKGKSSVCSGTERGREA